MDCYDIIERKSIHFDYIQAIENKEDAKNASNSSISQTQHKPIVQLVRCKAKNTKRAKNPKAAAIIRKAAKTSKEIYDFISYN